ncbi:MAG: rod shape-determining protein [Deltaproteobacteria bacterium]|nr:MAG: rod shape-determining protein [Deltaproteobacteria bacterium]
MFSAVLGLFSQDLAVDLGSSETRIYQRGSGVVIAEPTVVAVRTDHKGRRSVLAVGADARPMLGRTPANIEACEPVRDGRIADFEVAEALMMHLVRRVHGRNGWMRPRVALAISHCATDMERRATREACEAAGARFVHLVPRPVAAALGAGLPVDEAGGYLVVDIGAGQTEIGVISLHQVVHGTVVPGGGRGMDLAVQRWLYESEGLLVGDPSARALKECLGAALPPNRPQRDIVRGRCARRGLPRAAEIDAVDVHTALSPAIDAIAAGIRRVVKGAPPELAADIAEHGVLLTGGGARLRGIEGALRERTGLPVVVEEDPEHAVIRGTGAALESLAVLEAVTA